jgi:hypothetical protein
MPVLEYSPFDPFLLMEIYFTVAELQHVNSSFSVLAVELARQQWRDNALLSVANLSSSIQRQADPQRWGSDEAARIHIGASGRDSVAAGRACADKDASGGRSHDLRADPRSICHVPAGLG